MQKVANIEEIKKVIGRNGEMVISRNDENGVIIMNIEEYRKKILKENIEEHLLKSEEDIKNGRVRDAKEVFKEWKEKYGI